MCTQGFSVVGEAAGLRPGTHLATGRTGVWSFWECITNSSPKVASAARLFRCQLQCCKIPSARGGERSYSYTACYATSVGPLARVDPGQRRHAHGGGCACHPSTRRRAQGETCMHSAGAVKGTPSAAGPRKKPECSPGGSRALSQECSLRVIFKF